LKNKFIYRGIFCTTIASIFWGLPQPLYFNQINFIPAIEIVCHRAIWSFIFLLIIIKLIGKTNDLRKIIKNKKCLLYLFFTGSLIACNWTGFILAINYNRLQDASMGYFLSPIISIGLGYIFLKEKLSFLQSASVFLMIFAVLFLIISLKSIPFLAILISLTWAFYGLIRKNLNISSEIGLFFESFFISFFALIYLIFLYISGEGYFLNHNTYTSLLLIFTGAISIFPLFFFNIGVRNIPLGVAGVIFYLAPTFHFITSIFILNEQLSLYKLISFIIIWLAVILFIYEKFNEKNKVIESNTQLLN